ncbi:outer membrane beta-barrel protein [Hymenobacter antarcticus]
MRFLSLALGGLLFAAALPARAQASAETPAPPRYYVGLGAYSSSYQQLGGQSTAYNSSVRLPVQLTAGYQLRPRLAVQVGVAYSGSTMHYAFVGRTYGSGPTGYIDYRADLTSRLLSTTVLARYTLTRKAAHHVQFDALGGFTLEHGRGFERGTRADSLGGTRNVTNFSNRSSRSVLLLTAGLGTRFRLSPRFELFYDFTLNKALTGPASRPAPVSLTGSSALGLRYRFGRR